MKETSRIKKIAIIIGVLLLPLIYSITYLKGFWDPYNNLGNMKVAVINEDKCTDECKSTDLIEKLKDSDTFNFVLKDEKEAEEGLLNKKYFATITIPEDFTFSLENAESKDRTASTIVYRTNKKTNYIAAQLIENAVLRVEKELDKEVSKEIVSGLSDKLNEVPDQTSKIVGALDQIYTGTVTLNNGANKLSEGANTLYVNSNKIDSGIDSLNGGVGSLKNGFQSLKDGVNSLSAGTKEIKNGTLTIKNSVSDSNTELKTKVGELQAGLTELNSGSTNLKNGVASYNNLVTKILGKMASDLNIIASGSVSGEQARQIAYVYTLSCENIVALDPTSELGQNINALITQKPEYKNKTLIEVLQASSLELASGSNNLDSGIKTLTEQLTSSLTNIATNMDNLETGLSKLSDGVTKLDEGVNGSNGLVNGVGRLDSGIKTLFTGSNTLNSNYKTFNEGVNTLNKGTSALKDGTNELSNGVKTAKDTASAKIDDSKEELSALNGLDEYAKTPVKFKDNSYGIVKDYGTFFSPFFMSLSLWLGGLLIVVGLYYDPEKRFKILGKNSENRPKRLFYYTIIGIAQSIILPIVLVFILNFTVTNWALFFASCILIGLSFLSIMLFMVFNWDDIGKFLAVFLLVIQLAACAGTFPLETEPAFFGAISPFMPMTYSVELLRESFVSIDSHFLVKDVIVLTLILVVFGSLILITGMRKTKKEKIGKKLI